MAMKRDDSDSELNSEDKEDVKASGSGNNSTDSGRKREPSNDVKGGVPLKKRKSADSEKRQEEAGQIPIARVSSVSDKQPMHMGVSLKSPPTAMDGSSPAKAKAKELSSSATAAAKRAHAASQHASRSRGKGRARLPEKLMEYLNSEAAPGVLWWLPGNESFAMESSRVQEELLDAFFRGSKLHSFVRSLNRWGFRRTFLEELPKSVMCFRHKMFKKSAPHLLKNMELSSYTPQSSSHHGNGNSSDQGDSDVPDASSKSPTGSRRKEPPTAQASITSREDLEGTNMSYSQQAPFLSFVQQGGSRTLLEGDAAAPRLDTSSIALLQQLTSATRRVDPVAAAISSHANQVPAGLEALLANAGRSGLNQAPLQRQAYQDIPESLLQSLMPGMASTAPQLHALPNSSSSNVASMLISAAAQAQGNDQQALLQTALSLVRREPASQTQPALGSQSLEHFLVPQQMNALATHQQSHLERQLQQSQLEGRSQLERQLQQSQLEDRLQHFLQQQQQHQLNPQLLQQQQQRQEQQRRGGTTFPWDSKDDKQS